MTTKQYAPSSPNPSTGTKPWLSVIVSGWPRVSETFALNELLTLYRSGVLHSVFATKGGNGSPEQPSHRDLAPIVHTLPDGDADEQARAVAEALAGTDVRALHAYFAHHPATVAERAATALGIPWGLSTHALDARKVHAEELARRVRAARVVVACNDDVARSISDVGGTALLLRHGVDTDLFRPGPDRATRTPLRLVAVGRFVEKKGFAVLFDALTRLTCDWHLTLIGDGPLQHTLHERASEHRGRVTLTGALTHEQLPALLRSCDLAVVPSVIDSNGDRDGLPNVVLEAMASGLAVVASDVAAIASAVDHDVTGLLVAPGDAAQLAATIDRVAADSPYRTQLGKAARRRARNEFSLRSCTDALTAALEAAYV